MDDVKELVLIVPARVYAFYPTPIEKSAFAFVHWQSPDDPLGGVKEAFQDMELDHELRWRRSIQVGHAIFIEPQLLHFSLLQGNTPALLSPQEVAKILLGEGPGLNWSSVAQLLHRLQYNLASHSGQLMRSSEIDLDIATGDAARCLLRWTARVQTPGGYQLIETTPVSLAWLKEQAQSWRHEAPVATK